MIYLRICFIHEIDSHLGFARSFSTKAEGQRVMKNNYQHDR